MAATSPFQSTHMQPGHGKGPQNNRNVRGSLFLNHTRIFDWCVDQITNTIKTHVFSGDSNASAMSVNYSTLNNERGS